MKWRERARASLQETALDCYSPHFSTTLFANHKRTMKKFINKRGAKTNGTKVDKIEEVKDGAKSGEKGEQTIGAKRGRRNEKGVGERERERERENERGQFARP